MRQASVAQLFDYHRERLQLLHVGGTLDAQIAVNQLHTSPADLVGHLNLIHPDRIQVIGAPEINWATQQHTIRVSRHMRRSSPPARRPHRRRRLRHSGVGAGGLREGRIPRCSRRRSRPRW
jgi:HPr kinase/phosphorylase